MLDVTFASRNTCRLKHIVGCFNASLELCKRLTLVEADLRWLLAHGKVNGMPQTKMQNVEIWRPWRWWECLEVVGGKCGLRLVPCSVNPAAFVGWLRMGEEKQKTNQKSVVRLRMMETLQVPQRNCRMVWPNWICDPLDF